MSPFEEIERSHDHAGVASLRYGLEILGLFSSERPWLRLGEIAEAIGLSPLDAHTQVSAMRRMNFVQEGPGRRYGLGCGPPDLGMAAIRAMGIARRAREHLVEIHERTRCPVALAMLDGTELIVVDRAQAPGTRKLEMTIDLGRSLPTYATALGKVLLAYLPEHREHAFVEGLQLDRFTSLTITDRQRLLSHLQEVRSAGIAVEDREHMAHRRCFAAPVRGAQRRVVAAVGLTMTDRYTPLRELLDLHRDSLLQTAERLSGALEFAQVDWPEL